MCFTCMKGPVAPAAPIRAVDRPSGQDDPRPVQLLQAMPEHGTIAFLQNRSA